MAERRLPQVGEVVMQRYRVLAERGGGAMGALFQADDLQRGHRVALKVLRPEILGVPEVVERLRREGLAVSLIDHDNVVRIWDVGATEHGLPFLSMEWLEGTDLGAVLEKLGAIPLHTAVGWVRQACAGLAEAHARGIVHRDIKPENLFLATGPTGEPVVKVIDFGVSKLDLGAAHLTQTHVTVGTPLYMSPEQVRAQRDIDARSDVWALGVVLFELLSGSPPFIGESAHAVTASIVADPPRALEDLVRVPPEVAAIVARALAKKPAERFEDTRALSAALAPFELPPSQRLPELEGQPTLVTELPPDFDLGAPASLSRPTVEPAPRDPSSASTPFMASPHRAASRPELAQTLAATQPAGPTHDAVRAPHASPSHAAVHTVHTAPMSRPYAHAQVAQAPPHVQHAPPAAAPSLGPVQGRAAPASKPVSRTTVVVAGVVMGLAVVATGVFIALGVRARKDLDHAPSAAPSREPAGDSFARVMAARAAAPVGGFRPCIMSEGSMELAGVVGARVEPREDLDVTARGTSTWFRAPGVEAKADDGSTPLELVSPLAVDFTREDVSVLLVTNEARYAAIVGETGIQPLDDASLDRLAQVHEDGAAPLLVVVEGDLPVTALRDALRAVRKVASVGLAIVPRREAPSPNDELGCVDLDPPARAATKQETQLLAAGLRAAEETCGRDHPFDASASVTLRLLPGTTRGQACWEGATRMSPRGRACAVVAGKRLSAALPISDKREVTVQFSARGQPVRAFCE